MSDLYLIAHKVYNEPAFDAATRMQCPECNGTGRRGIDVEAWCAECDSEGFWWIIPTSGHRAYPWWHTLIKNIDDTYQLDFEPTQLEGPGPMPPDLPDHYHLEQAAEANRMSLAQRLGIAKPKPKPKPIVRRL
jgi:hypothetical protein